MGRQDPERQRAIAAELDEMMPSTDEEFHDFMTVCDSEDSRAIVESNEFQERVNRIHVENERLGITPTAWFCALQSPSTEDCMVRDKLIERWELENMSDPDDSAAWFDDYYNFPSYNPLTDLEIAEERFGEMCADPLGFNDPEPADEWSGPAIPPSAIRDL